MKRKFISEEIAEVDKKKKHLEIQIEDLIKEEINLQLKRRRIMLLGRSKNLRKLTAEKNQLIKDNGDMDQF